MVPSLPIDATVHKPSGSTASAVKEKGMTSNVNDVRAHRVLKAILASRESENTPFARNRNKKVLRLAEMTPKTATI